ncbi:MAG TPA: histone deacetylase [Solirubrobacterales bacterium]|nr:histone deacetylase [Solirubrobacterales bacterium]
MLLFHHPACLQHDPRELLPGHPEAPPRLAAIEAELAARDWLGGEPRTAPPASEAELELVHPAWHVESIRELSAAGGGTIDADTAAGARSYEAARHAAGAACAMTRALLGGEDRLAFSLIRPPGHHAEPQRAMGFCLFNNVAIAAELAMELGAERVLIFDWDVHHGNGTEAAFRDRDDVLFASIHQYPFYPGTGGAGDRGSGAGEGFTLNLPVPAGAGGELWLSLVEEQVGPAAIEFGPDLVLVSAGFDAHRDDPLASCELETADFAAIAERTGEIAAVVDAPLGLVLEGGYSPPALAGSVAATIEALHSP